MQRSQLGPQKSLVGFVVGDVSYALDIAVVREIINPQEISKLPHLPAEVVGVTDYRGQVAPIVDLRLRFGLAHAEPTRATKWILVGSQERVIGLIVDRVTEVFGTGGVELGPLPDVGDRQNAEAILGVFRQGHRLTFVVDARRFINLADDPLVRSALPA